MQKGSCLCGKVTYEVAGELGEAGHCHCHMCQKAHGAAFGTYANVRWEQFTVVSGASEITTYASSEGICRTFCRHCGSTLQFIREGKPYFGLAIGTLDTVPGKEPTYQIWTSSKAPWLKLPEGLLSHETQPGKRGRVA